MLLFVGSNSTQIRLRLLNPEKREIDGRKEYMAYATYVSRCARCMLEWDTTRM